MSANLSLELIKCLINQPGVDVNVRLCGQNFREAIQELQQN